MRLSSRFAARHSPALAHARIVAVNVCTVGSSVGSLSACAAAVWVR